DDLWRRERDSNPRHSITVQWFSRPPPSTSRTPLHYLFFLIYLKKLFMILLHSRSFTPKIVSTLLLKLGSSIKFITEPQQPLLGSIAPITSLFILELIIPPAHMLQGSRVTYIVQSISLQPSKYLLASFMAIISAWA